MLFDLLAQQLQGSNLSQISRQLGTDEKTSWSSCDDIGRTFYCQQLVIIPQLGHLSSASYPGRGLGPKQLGNLRCSIAGRGTATGSRRQYSGQPWQLPETTRKGSRRRYLAACFRRRAIACRICRGQSERPGPQDDWPAPEDVSPHLDGWTGQSEAREQPGQRRPQRSASGRTETRPKTSFFFRTLVNAGFGRGRQRG